MKRYTLVIMSLLLSSIATSYAASNCPQMTTKAQCGLISSCTWHDAGNNKGTCDVKGAPARS